MRGSTNSPGQTQPKSMVFTGLTIAASDWVKDSTLSNYPYRAAISCPGVTANYWSYITFDPDFEEVDLCPGSQTFLDGVFAYAAEIPTKEINVLSVFCLPIGSGSSNSNSNAEVYTGAYTASPTYSAQTLNTAGKVLLDDITIEEISVSTSGNDSGGNTVIIGG